MVWVFLSIVLVSILAAVGYEVYALANQRPGDTISELFWAVSGAYPILPFCLGLVIGMLAGHFFWQRPL